MFAPKEVFCRVCGITSGLLLGLPNLFPAFAPVQCVALLPILFCIAKWKFPRGVLLTAGLYMALAYTVPQVVALLMPVPIVIILIADFTIVMMILSITADKLLTRSSVKAVIALAAFAAVLDWANYTAVPIWGTAQSLVRPWSSYPRIIAFSSITGMDGILFIIVLLQAAFVKIVLDRSSIRRMVTLMISAAAIFAAMSLSTVFQKPGSSLTVAAVGWSGTDLDPQTAEGFEKLYADQVRHAAALGAKLVVSPEMAFYVDRYDYPAWIDRVSRVADENNVYLAAGFLDAAEYKNKMIFVDPDGKILTEYVKRYLTPFENFNKGDGQPKIIEIDGIKIGSMICHDDNYTPISRRYGKQHAGIIAVPTLDWKSVRFAHLQSCIHRSVESGHALVRAAFDGVSAIISPKGEVLAGFDHITGGAGIVVGKVQVYSGCTLFSRLGNWFVLACGIFILAYLILPNVYSRRKVAY